MVLFLLSQVAHKDLDFLGKNLEFVGCHIHFLAKPKSRFCLRSVTEDIANISQASEYPIYISHNIILRQVFSIFSSFLVCSSVRLGANATLQYSILLRTNRQYISNRSSIETPAYLSFESIDIRPYDFLHISAIFTLQSPASSDIQTPRILTTFLRSIVSPLMDSRVVKSCWQRENTM